MLLPNPGIRFRSGHLPCPACKLATMSEAQHIVARLSIDCDNGRKGSQFQSHSQLSQLAPSPVVPPFVALDISRDLIVGRDATTCYPAFESALVSKKHFRIYAIVYEEENLWEFPPGFFCEDLRSTNGTYVNNKLIRRPQLLCDGDTIEIRPHWSFTFLETLETEGKDVTTLQAAELRQFDGLYHINDRKLGAGSFGKVYLAMDKLSHQQLACKVVDLTAETLFKSTAGAKTEPFCKTHSQFSTKKSEKFAAICCALRKSKLEREIEILGKINHPNIVTLHKAFRSPHTLYMLMELASGGDMISFLHARANALLEIEAKILAKQILSGIEYLHSKHIVHRDLKPENILVMNTEIGARVVLTDFGSAISLESSSVRMKSQVGTSQYRAPEAEMASRNVCGDYTMAIDIWGFAVILVILLTGLQITWSKPVRDIRQSDIEEKIQEAKNTRAISHDAETLLRKLLVLKPHERITSKQAADDDWFKRPAGVKELLKKVLDEANRTWKPRRDTRNIIQDLPDLTATPSPSNARNRTHDVTSSPVFNLDAHITSRESSRLVKLRRKRLLAQLYDSGEKFLPDNGSFASHHRSLGGRGRVREVPGRNMFGSAPVELEALVQLEDGFAPMEPISDSETCSVVSQSPGYQVISRRP